MHPEHCGLCRIEVDHVTVTAGGETLLSDISLHLHCGQLTALVGPNGAGKTTLIRALLGQIPHTGVIRHMDERERVLHGVRTGYVPQQLPFDRQMPVPVSDFLATALTRRPVWTGVSKKTREQVKEALSLAQAERLQGRMLGQLSGGELQRVLLAMALTPVPDLLILDEPVSGVDQNGLFLFLDTVAQLKRRHHLAILLISHDWALVRQYADEVVLLNKNVLGEGAPEAVFGSEAFREAFPAWKEDA
ncbi:MAG: metal ABC transporter ATP-binding protein [Clostridia bacterium]|nr:metal ABC transporter ATP-binding protein [Clostridia bacterium]